MRFLRPFIGIVFGIPLVIGGLVQLSDSQQIFYSLCCLVPGLLLIYWGLLRKDKKQKQKIKYNKENSIVDFAAIHVYGLPVSQGAQCVIHYSKNGIKTVVAGVDFNLDISKITDITVKTETEITSQYVSSIGGAVGGAVLFGPLGAIIGGRAKKKKNKKNTNYFIVTYIDENEIKYIGYEVFNISIPYKAVNEFKKNKTTNIQSYEL